MPMRTWVPTPEEIAQEAARIRSEWTEEERQKRLRCDWRSPRWQAPETSLVVDSDQADD